MLQLLLYYSGHLPSTIIRSLTSHLPRERHGEASRRRARPEFRPFHPAVAFLDDQVGSIFVYQILLPRLACKRLERRQVFRERLIYPFVNQVGRLTEAGAMSTNSDIDTPKGIRTWWKFRKT